MIYLSARPSEQFKSFSAPVLNFDDTHISSSFFGPWSWTGLVKPVSGGGIPADVPRVEVKMTFKDGGHEAFREKFETIKERLHHAREIQAETGQLITTDEPLPQYEAAAASCSGSGSSQANLVAPAAASERPTSHNQPAPDEPPPDYEEAQAQAVGMRFEERMREEADRG